MNCPYCNEPADQLDSIVKLPNGDRVHFRCSDKMLEEWQELKDENSRLRLIAHYAYRLYDICADIPIDFTNADRFVWIMDELKDCFTDWERRNSNVRPERSAGDM